MSDAREQQFQAMVKDFPDSPMGHFSLGRYYLEGNRFSEAAAALSRAVALDPSYLAAMVALSEAQIGAGQKDEARGSLVRARELALAQHHEGLAEELEEKLEEL